jgi:predicted kinase
MKNIICCTLGRTASGKTTIAKYISENIKFIYISEGKIKREIMLERKEYSTNDSLNEELRNQGYKKAIGLCKQHIKNGNNVIIDASFHKLFRRKWLYSIIQECRKNLFMIYLRCDNLEKVKSRIRARKSLLKHADTQADSMSIYYHIDQTFDEPTSTELKDTSIVLFKIDTDKNKIIEIINNDSPIKDVEIFRKTLNRYTTYMRLKQENV